MNRSPFVGWFLHHRRGHLSQGAEAALFQGLRMRLTLWYCGVLAAALVLFSVVLYLGAQYFLLAPVEADVAMHAHAHVKQWLVISPARACSSFFPSDRPDSLPPALGSTSEIVACFDQNGSLLPNANTALLPTAFLSNSLVKKALHEGRATDTVDGGAAFGRIHRYALAVPDLTGRGNVGVVLIGESVQTQENDLSLLLTLLLTIGGTALLGAGLGGLFLANRALAPARLAWRHQQRFIADASHELRTPLTLLRADAEVLLRNREHLAAADAELLEDIVAEANHMARLSTNMLALARLDNGSSHREHEVVNLAELASAGVRRVQALAEQVEISIQAESPGNPQGAPHRHQRKSTRDNTAESSRGVSLPAPSSGSPHVIGDPLLLEQAVLAILDNAIKYNRRGGHVTVHTTTQNEQALLEVSDTGIGIAAEHLPHLGERFYRVDKARSREAGGTGLGLSIARSIAIAHSGTLTLTSILDQGTTVTLTLPLAHVTGET